MEKLILVHITFEKNRKIGVCVILILHNFIDKRFFRFILYILEAQNNKNNPQILCWRTYSRQPPSISRTANARKYFNCRLLQGIIYV